MTEEAAQRLYDVHVFAIVRVKESGISAASPEAAIKKAIDGRNWYDTFNLNDEMEFADEFSHYLVDEVGDEEYERSAWYDDYCHRNGPVDKMFRYDDPVQGESNERNSIDRV